jgi:EmrB/QacA subfamily drug resistance transporter
LVTLRAEMKSTRHSWMVTAIALGAFVGMLDATIVAVALGPISRRFALPLASGQEVIAVYLVVVMATLPTIGRLSDRFGRRKAYVAGFVLFSLGSLVAATAPSFAILLVGRMIQAVGGGVLMAGSLALIAEHLPRNRTGRSVAIVVTTQAVAGLIGPPLGGLLVLVGGWQTVFWAGVPLGVIGIVLTLTAIPASVAHRESGIDIPGAVLLSAIFLGVGAGISSLAAPAFGDIPAIAWFSVAWIALLLVVPAELMAPKPLVDRRLFRQSRFVSATVATLLSTGTLMSCFAILPFWLEEAHGVSPVIAGLAFLPIGVGVGATSRVGGRMGDAKRTQLVTAAGMSLAALGFALAALATHRVSWPLLLPGLFMIGCGNGLFSSPNTSAAMRLAPRDALGSAAAVLSAARNAGVITGLGITGAIYTAAGSSRADIATATIFVAAAIICMLVAGIALVTYRPMRALGALHVVATEPVADVPLTISGRRRDSAALIGHVTDSVGNSAASTDDGSVSPSRRLG